MDENHSFMKSSQDRGRPFIPRHFSSYSGEPLLPTLVDAPSDSIITTRLRFKQSVNIKLTPLLLPVFVLLQQELFSIVSSST